MGLVDVDIEKIAMTELSEKLNCRIFLHRGGRRIASYFRCEEDSSIDSATSRCYREFLGLRKGWRKSDHNIVKHPAKLQS